MEATGPRAPARPPFRAWALVLVAGTWLGFLLRAPAGIPTLWAFDGFRSVEPLVRVGLLIATALVAVLCWTRPTSRLWALAAVAGATLVSFPLRESIHWLSDTALRLNAWHDAAQGGGSFADWQRVLHAAPLDQLLDFRLAVWLHRLGLPEVTVASVLSLAGLVAYGAACLRIARRFADDPRDRPALAAFVVLAGALQAFAGYAESAGLLLAAFAWWLALLLEPVGSRGAAARLAAAWLVFGLCHRVAVLEWPVLLARAAWPVPADTRAGRRALVVAALVAPVALLALQGAAAAPQLRADAADLVRAWRALAHANARTRADLLGALVLLAPAALIGALLATRRAWRAGRHELRALALAAAPLLLVMPALPLGVNGLGIERDWDLLSLPALALGVAGVALIARGALPVRHAAALALPVIALQTASWLAVNADPAASVDRAIALASDPGHLADPQRSHLLMYLGDRARSAEDPMLAADLYERSFLLSGNPRRALYAASAWLAAGDTDSAAAWVSVAKRLPLVSPGVSLGAAWLDSVTRLRRPRPPATAVIPPAKH